MNRRAPLVLAAVTASFVLAACGSEGNEVKGQSANVERGSQLFADRCSGCHSLDVVGAQGGSEKPSDIERTDGPNFNVRKECVSDVLHAVRNGGFSGAIMPENIVVGQDAQDVAEFLQEYSGRQATVAAGATAKRC